MNNAKKVVFKLVRDEDGYPPVDYERLWGVQVDGADDQYIVDNIPYFVPNIAIGDIVLTSAGNSEDEVVFEKVLQASSHGTVRVIFYDRSIIELTREHLKNLGCSSELSHLENLIAVDIPENVKYLNVKKYLSEKAKDGLIDYEEAVLPPENKLG